MNDVLIIKYIRTSHNRSQTLRVKPGKFFLLYVFRRVNDAMLTANGVVALYLGQSTASPHPAEVFLAYSPQGGDC